MIPRFRVVQCGERHGMLLWYVAMPNGTKYAGPYYSSKEADVYAVHASDLASGIVDTPMPTCIADIRDREDNEEDL